MDADARRDHAARFIESLRDMGPERLQALIAGEAGEALATFFTTYAGRAVTEAAETPVATASTLMMLGYLIRADEEIEAKAAKAPT